MPALTRVNARQGSPFLTHSDQSICVCSKSRGLRCRLPQAAVLDLRAPAYHHTEKVSPSLGDDETFPGVARGSSSHPSLRNVFQHMLRSSFEAGVF